MYKVIITRGNNIYNALYIRNYMLLRIPTQARVAGTSDPLPAGLQGDVDSVSSGA